MKRLLLANAVQALLFQGFTLHGFGQQVTTQKGLTTVEFRTANGIVKVYLPNDVREGETISGTVQLFPNGTGTNKAAKSLDQLLQTQISVGKYASPTQPLASLQQKNPTNNSSFAFKTIAKQPFDISITDIKGAKKEQPIALHPNVEMPSFNYCALPTHAMAGSPLVIQGPFDGDCSNTNCNLNNTSMEVLAESPRQCIVQIPQGLPAQNLVAISEAGNKMCEVPLNTVDLSVSADKLNLKRGEQTMVHILVTGLNALKDTAKLTISNLSTGLIALSPANEQRIILLPDSFKTTGTYKKDVTVTGLQTGDYTMNVNLDLPGIQAEVKEVKLASLNNPGSYGWRGGDPCENKGPITWRWHRTLQCAIEIKVNPYGTPPAEKEVIDWIIDKLKELSKKGGKIGERMSKCFSFNGKAFSIYARCYRDWEDWDVTYVCVDGVWQQESMVLVGSGRDNLSGWMDVRNGGGNNEWFATDDANWLTDALIKSVTCCD